MQIDVEGPVWNESALSAHNAPHVCEHHRHVVSPELVNRHAKPDDSAWMCGDTRQVVQFQGRKWPVAPLPDWTAVCHAGYIHLLTCNIFLEM